MTERLKSLTADGCLKFASYNEANHPVQDLTLTSQWVEAKARQTKSVEPARQNHPDQEISCGQGIMPIAKAMVKPMAGGASENGESYVRMETVQSVFGPKDPI